MRLGQGRLFVGTEEYVWDKLEREQSEESDSTFNHMDRPATEAENELLESQKENKKKSIF